MFTGILVIGFVVGVSSVGLYRLGVRRGRADEFERSRTKIDDIRRRAMSLLQRSRVRYEADELEELKTDDDISEVRIN